MTDKYLSERAMLMHRIKTDRERADMTYISQQPPRRSRTQDQLDRIPMSDAERRQAKAALEQGERVAEFVVARLDELRRLTAAARRLGARLAVAARARFTKTHRARTAPRQRRTRARAT